MSEYSPTWCTELYGILIHPRELRILMLWGAAGWSLPHMSLDRAVWEADVGKVSEAMRLALGAEVTTLRYASYSVSEDAHQIDAIYVLESHNPAWEPQDGAEWVGRAALADLPLAHPEHRALVAAHLAEAESGQIPEHRPPWARVGWFELAAAWTQSELARLGYSLSAPVEQIKSWGISCILRAHTASGGVYFKAASSLPLFAHEPAVMRGLSGLYPDHIPAPLSIDDQHRWMLLADFGAPIEWGAPVEVQEEMLRLYGELQRDAGGRPAGDRVPGPPPRTARSAGRPVAGGHSDACQPTGCGGDRATTRARAAAAGDVCRAGELRRATHSGAWRPPSRQRRTLRRELPILRLDRRLCSTPVFRHDQHLSGQRSQRAGAAAQQLFGRVGSLRADRAPARSLEGGKAAVCPAPSSQLPAHRRNFGGHF